MQPPKKCKHTIYDKNCKYCVQLKNKWYDKLTKAESKKPEDEQFHDIEKDEDYLKVYSSDTFRPRHIDKQAGGWQAKAEYFILATRFLNEYRFEEEILRVIWEYHSEGISNPKIAKTLEKLRFKKYSSPTKIAEIINKFKAKMFDLYIGPQRAYYE